MDNYFDVIKWLKEVTGNEKLSKDKINSLLTFVLMWSLFENKFFPERNTLNSTGLRKLAKEKLEKITLDNYLIFLKHFQRRYIENNTRLGKKRFSNLRLNQFLRAGEESDKDYVGNTLKGKINPERCLTSLFLITHRFRNNLFHGGKNPIHIQLYEPEFNILNQFLAKFIDNCLFNDSK